MLPFSRGRETHINKLGGHFEYFLFFFSAGGGAGGVQGTRKGRGSFFLLKIPRGGRGFSRFSHERRGGGRGREGVCREFLGGAGGANFFSFRGRNSHQHKSHRKSQNAGTVRGQSRERFVDVFSYLLFLFRP